MPRLNPSPQSTRTTAGSTSLVDRINLSVHVRRYAKLVARRWLILIVCVLAGVGYYTYRAFTTPFLYQSYSTIGFPPKVRTASYGVNRPEIVEEMSRFYENQIAVMKSGTVLDRVREKVSTARPLGIGSVRSVDAVPGKGSWFEMIVQGTDFETARLFASEWATEFIRYKEERYGLLFGKSAADLQREKLNFEQKRDEIQAEIDRFIQKHQIGSVQTTLEGTQKNYDELYFRLTEVQNQRALLEGSTVDSLLAKGAGHSLFTSASDGPNATGDNAPLSRTMTYASLQTQQYADLRTELSLKEAEARKHEGVLREAHPVLVQLRSEISMLEFKIDALRKIFEDRRRAQIADLEQQEKAYEKRLVELKDDRTRYAALELAYNRLVRSQENIDETLRGIERQLNETQLASRDEERFEIREAGMGAPVPISPNRPKMVITGLLLGLGMGLAIIYFLHRLDDRLELAQDLEEALQEPVLGQIPLVCSPAASKGRLLITHLDQQDFFAESIRGIRSAILFGSQTGNKQVLLATSAVPGDGKTTFTVNFAITLALAGNRVLLIDSDLRRGSTHQFFEMERDPGLANILVGDVHWLDVLRETFVNRLHLISSGPIPPNPGELLISPIAEQLMQEVRQAYDYIVVDCPPVTGIDDTFSLLSFSDGVLFVVRAGQTSMRFARNALAGIRHRGARILGLVLNGITADNPYYYYYSYYNEYYSKISPSSHSSTTTTPGARMPAPRRAFPSIESSARVRSMAQSLSPSAESHPDKGEYYRALRAQRAARLNPRGSDPQDHSGPASGHGSAAVHSQPASRPNGRQLS